MKRMRLLKVNVQPIFVLDDGETLTEQPGQAVALSPADLAGFPADLAAQIEAYNAEPAS